VIEREIFRHTRGALLTCLYSPRVECQRPRSSPVSGVLGSMGGSRNFSKIFGKWIFGVALRVSFDRVLSSFPGVNFLFMFRSRFVTHSAWTTKQQHSAQSHVSSKKQSYLSVAVS